MAVTFTACNCPECGATLPVEDGRSSIFCSYCGTKIIISNENEHIYRSIDEAAEKEIEYRHEMETKRLELLLSDRKKYRSLAKISFAIFIILFFVMIIGGQVLPDIVIGIMIVIEFITFSAFALVLEHSGDIDEKIYGKEDDSVNLKRKKKH